MKELTMEELLSIAIFGGRKESWPSENIYYLQMRQETKEILTRFAELQAEVDKKNEEIAILKNVIASDEKSNKNLIKRNEEMRGNCIKTAHDRDIAIQEVARLTAENNQISARLRAQEAENERLKVDMVEHFHKEHLQGDGPEIDRWKRQNKELTAELVSNREVIEQLQNGLSVTNTLLAAEKKAYNDAIALLEAVNEELAVEREEKTKSKQVVKEGGEIA